MTGKHGWHFLIGQTSLFYRRRMSWRWRSRDEVRDARGGGGGVRRAASAEGHPPAGAWTGSGPGGGARQRGESAGHEDPGGPGRTRPLAAAGGAGPRSGGAGGGDGTRRRRPRGGRRGLRPDG